jgi:hypothetical protein
MRAFFPTIHRLFFGCGPSAIGRFVVAAIVDAVKAVPDRSRSHISEKVYETISPSLTNCNAASAPVFEIGGAWIQAARFHSAPRLVFGAFSPCCTPMYQMSVGGHFTVDAAATGRVTVNKVATGHSHLTPTITLTEPVNTVWMLGSKQHGESAKFAATEINQRGHMNTILALRRA